ncbi:arylsulfotransferase family protein [Glutamicibacter sp. MNS18]|uniref:arylsulfotransferase family protein n=1 Tax=Glutamicibacter sp. MNS18 TaxID=2989817 RepID=UPI00223645EF|nr:arylsulfotransferase family protein [Glutamicibacter sp. MNS18]MCW4465713.1 arylsulfotransferase family protein [Glutamicibacter sp. MNS18]
MGERTTRKRYRQKQYFVGIFAALLTVALSGCGPGQGEPAKQAVPHHSFVSHPDFAPPPMDITPGPAWRPDYEESTDLLFLTPIFETDTPSSGAMIFDSRGELVWMVPSDPADPTDNYFDLRVQQYRGEDVLTVYRGTRSGGRGNGEILILDQSYEPVASVTTAGSLGPDKADFHDSTITADDTMLIASYAPVPADLSALGGPEEGMIKDAVIQEIDIATGEVIFEWSATEHIPLTQTLLDFDVERNAQTDDEEELGTEGKPFDYFHINSMTEDHEGTILVSARHTSAVYRLDRVTGEVIWTLGGSASDFDLDEDAVFAWQHDAQRAPDGTLTLLDNHARGTDDQGASRALRLALDEQAMTASVVTEYHPLRERSSGSMANAQELANGNMLIGWGSQSHYSEHEPGGEVIYDVCHGESCYPDNVHGRGTSYRAYKAHWQGQPSGPPRVVVNQTEDEQVAYVSWNGATHVAQWRLIAGADEATAIPQARVEAETFETAFTVPGNAQYVGIQALDAEGRVLATGIPD